MNPAAMVPFGHALRAYFSGQSDASLLIRREDGHEDRLPMCHFFRPPAEFSPIEAIALERCRGHILDIGAGSGQHSLVLQAQGKVVSAMDINRDAVDVMLQRGVRDVRCADVCRARGGPFDTMLMLGHGIGMVEDLSGLDRFLAHAHRLAGSNAQLFAHSRDVRQTDDPAHLAYHDANRRAGRYVGEIRIQFEFEGQSGPSCGWLHVDANTLCERAERAGWGCEIVSEDAGGEYLAQLSV